MMMQLRARGCPRCHPRLGPAAQVREGQLVPNKYRLSMSHDSIFQTGGEPAAGMDSAASIPSLPSSSSRLAAELRSVLTKKRGDDVDDDSGLPRSPATPPDGPLHTSKTPTGKSGGSCSDGSMLSIYSSGTGTGTDDDIFGPLSDNSSRVSLSRDQDSAEPRPPGVLSHAAAKHRIAVRPKRNHGASRPRRPAAAASLPATVEEEGAEQSPPAGKTEERNGGNADQGAPAAGTERGRATLPAAGVAERATPVQRSRSTIADRRLRDLSPRKLWGRDTSEPAPEKKSEGGFFSRLFGSRRSGRKRKTGKETEEAPRPQPRSDVSQEDKEKREAVVKAPEPEPARPPVSLESVRSAPPAEVASEPDVVDKPPENPVVKERKQSAAALAREMKEAGLLAARREEMARAEEDKAPASPQEEEVRQEEQAQRSPEVTVRPRSILRTGSRSVSQGSEGAEQSEPPAPKTSVDDEPRSLESIPDQETPAEVAPVEINPEEPEENDQEQSQEQEEHEESPPVLRRRRETPERTEEERSSPLRRSSGSQKLSWMEELRRSPPREASTGSGHELRKTYVKEARSSSSGEEEVQRTPSWVKEEQRKTPPSSGHELRKTWIKEQPKTPPAEEKTKTTPPWVKDELRKSPPPLAAEEDRPPTPPWITEELQRASMPPSGPSSMVPLRPARAKPVRRPASSADPTLSAPGGSPPGGHALFPSQPTAAQRRRASALVFGGAEPAPPPDSGPRSLDSAMLLAADRTEPVELPRPAPAADPAVSAADSARIGEGCDEVAASPAGSSERLSGTSSEVEVERGSSEASENGKSEEDVSRSGSSESVVEAKVEGSRDSVGQESDREETGSGRPESASSSKASDRSGSRKSLAESVESAASDSGRCDDLINQETSILSTSPATQDRPDVPVKPRTTSETEPAVRSADAPPSSPSSEASRHSPVERTSSGEEGDRTPEFMRVHLHRVETPSAMTTQVVVPKPKPRESLSKPTAKAEEKEKAEVMAEKKVDAKKNEKKADAKPDHKFDCMTNDIPEVVLVEKHSPRQSRASTQSDHEDSVGSTVKTESEAPASPKSHKAAPEVPARHVLSSVRTPESSRNSSLGRQSTQDSDDSEPVVLRRRPPPPAAAATSTSPDSELLKVFKRRSLKSVNSEESAPKLSTPTSPVEDPLRVSTEEKDSDRPKPAAETASVSPSEARSVWNQRSVSMPVGGPKSPTVREAGPPSIGPIPTETAPVRPERPERPRKPAPPTQPRPSPSAAVTDTPAVVTEPPRVKATPETPRSVSAASAAAGPSGEHRRSVQPEEGAPTADWLKLVRERREQREQREQQTMRKLGHKEIIIEPDTLAPARAPAPRSSRVLEMANTFQKLQPT
ncbi:serine/arginine repetitive matrix protein 1-like isoform X1 [Amphibalanus amphitrite]|uniref:serine/arginine repetitive matrix protein 1-like isoform X1 n=1 Tax=Amphibalanus amphitrite TaxID=1232801 RepID=UPI001C912997|nr:serine/arginine repetitive matrix protein 1-like isoform X1 [Amphibalanus amphitrite]